MQSFRGAEYAMLTRRQCDANMPRRTLEGAVLCGLQSLSSIVYSVHMN